VQVNVSTGLPLDELRKSPVKHFSSDKVDKFVSRFHGNVDFGSEWRKYKEIAKDLSFSEGTVRNYLSNILDKLELRDRTQLAIWAISRGEL